MWKQRNLIVLSWLLMVLTGCTLSLRLEPPWEVDNVRLHRSYGDKQSVPSAGTTITQTVTVTQTNTVTKEVFVTLPTGYVDEPLHILAVAPLTKNASISVTQVITTVEFARACSVNEAIVFLPGYGSSVVLAAIARPTADGIDADNAFDPNAQRTIYWRGAAGTGDPTCVTTPWLWHQSLLLPATNGPAQVAALALPATNACAVTPGTTLNLFSADMTAQAMWPDLLAVQRSGRPPALVVLRHTPTCGSGAGCATLESICSEIFEDGRWRQWCTSLCR